MDVPKAPPTLAAGPQAGCGVRLFTGAPDSVGVAHKNLPDDRWPHRRSSGQEDEAWRVGRTHGMEVAVIDRGDLGDTESFRDRDE